MACKSPRVEEEEEECLRSFDTTTTTQEAQDASSLIERAALFLRADHDVLRGQDITAHPDLSLHLFIVYTTTDADGCCERAFTACESVSLQFLLLQRGRASNFRTISTKKSVL